MLQFFTRTQQFVMGKLMLLLLCCLLIWDQSLAKDFYPLQELVKEQREAGQTFREITPLLPDHSTKHKNLKQYVQGASFFELQPKVLQQVIKDRPATLKMKLPFQGSELEIELVQVELFSEDFRAVDSHGQEVDYERGVYYRGVETSEYNSLAFIGFTNSGIAGVIANNSGNLNLGALKGSDSDYILYRDRELDYNPTFQCGNDHLEIPDTPKFQEEQSGSVMRTASNCLNMYLEVDYDTYLDAGANTSAALDFMTSLFNNVIGLYQNEAIQMLVSEIKVWDTPDTYATGSASDALVSFRDQVPTYNGDLAHLVSRGLPEEGGMAWYDGLCQTFGNYGYAYTFIFMSYNAIPTYSWSVQGLTHEIGHNLNASHTHDCAWNGDQTAIDGCGDEAGYPGYGSCDTAAVPPNGQGSIISYCYLLDGFAFSFVYGFGEQPGDRIRYAVYNAPCLNPCGETCSDAGMACDDGDACTNNDVLDDYCNCSGSFADADNDGICDSNDICPGSDDAVDIDGDGTPDGCDSCIDVDGDGYCTNNDPDDSDGCNPSTEASGCYLNTNCENSYSFTDFESGWGGWIDGGNNAALVNAQAYSGIKSMRIRGAMNSSATCATGDMDWTGLDAASITFTYITNAMSSGEGFQLQGSLDGGATWGPIADFQLGTHFVNNEREFASVELTANFTSLTRLRFICMGSSNTDHVYMDDFSIFTCGQVDNCDVGASCDDGDSTTVGDVYNSNCECVGQQVPGCTNSTACNYSPSATVDDGSCEELDCAGSCGGSALPGVPCNDGDSTTVGDVYDHNCNCVGDQVSGCMDASACNYNPGATVDDGSCLESDCAGNCGGEALPATSCNDGNPDTINDVYNSNCECAGVIEEIPGCTNATACNYNPSANVDDGSCAEVDCLGICGGNAMPGTPCYDGSSATVDDTWDMNCNCQGIMPPGSAIGEVGEYNVSQSGPDQWHTVQMTQSYINPVVVAYSLSKNHSHAATIRVHSVTANSFKFQIDEWDYLDGTHGVETVGFMVVEAGIHTLADGRVIQAGLDVAGKDFRRIPFHEGFQSVPAVIVQPVTRNRYQAIAPRMRHINSHSFEARFQREQKKELSQYFHCDESIAWIAMPTGTGNNAGQAYQVGSTLDHVTHEFKTIHYEQVFDQVPAILTSINTYKGSDPTYVRFRNKGWTSVQIALYEEQSADSEMSHSNAESVSYFLFEKGPISGNLGMTMPLAAIAEAGEVIFSQQNEQQWRTIQLESSYQNPVVVAYSITENGSDPATIRVRNVLPESFQIQIDEWDYKDGAHGNEQVGYLVVEAGVHRLADGRIIQAGKQEHNGDFSMLSYHQQFTRTPVVVTQVSTRNQPQAVVTRMHSPNKFGIQCRIQREDSEELLGHKHGYETVSWIAMEQGFGKTGGTLYEIGKTSDRVKDAFTSVTYRQSFSEVPALVYGMQSYDGDNACFPRYKNKGIDRFQIRIAEEKSADAETIHTSETVGYMLFEKGRIYGCVETMVSGKTSNDSPEIVTAEEAEETQEAHEPEMESKVYEPILEVYPNPTTGMFYFEYQNEKSIADHIVIGLFTSDGKLITEQIHAFDQQHLRSEFDMGDLPGGMYLLRLVDADKVLNKKMILRK